MDENLMPVIGSLWDQEVEAQVLARVRPPVHNKARKIDKEGYLQDVEGVYHAIGGFARLAHTANEDPKWFYNRFGDRLLPNVKEELDVNISILPALPRSPLDGEYDEVPSDPPVSSLPAGDSSPGDLPVNYSQHPDRVERDTFVDPSDD